MFAIIVLMGHEGRNMRVMSERQNLNYCIFVGQEIKMTAFELRLQKKENTKDIFLETHDSKTLSCSEITSCFVNICKMARYNY